MFNTDGYSLSDLAAVTNKNDDGMFGSNNGAWQE